MAKFKERVPELLLAYAAGYVIGRTRFLAGLVLGSWLGFALHELLNHI